MRRRVAALVLAIVILGACLPGVGAQQVVDRIVARINGDVLTLSEMRELAGFQQLTGAKPASDNELVRQLVDQWIVSTEARAEQFPRPSEAAVGKAMSQVGGQFSSPEAFRSRLREAGLTVGAARRLLERQIHLLQFLDQKFRAAAQVEPAQIEAYYRQELVPQLTARGQQAPALESLQEQIRELLVQREISRLSARWIGESRANVKVEILTANGGP